jgi:cyclophilin family peptidyl-prolyl cis-trans isomerase/HEAT repeat protein
MTLRRARRQALAPFASAMLLGGCAASTAAGPTPSATVEPMAVPAELAPAAAALLRLEDRREWDSTVIASAARSPAALVRRRAALAAGRIGDARALPLLVSLLADADTGTAANAAFALGLLGDTAAVLPLAALLEPASVALRPTVVGAAASALGRMPTPASRIAVEGLLTRVPVGGANADAVGPALLAFWRYPRPADPAPVLPWLASSDPELRWRAAYSLTRRPDPRGTAALAALAADADERVRSFAVRSLTAPLVDSAGIGSAAALGTLLHAVEDTALPVRVNAVRALGTYPDPRSVDALRRILLGSDAHPALTAAEALARLGAKASAAAPDLRTAALDANRPIGLRGVAVAALVTVSPADAGSVAAALAREPGWRARAAAGQAFAALGADSRAETEALVRDPDPRVAAATLSAAVEAAGKEPAPLRSLLVESLGKPDVQVRAAAVAGLAALADPATLPLLLDAYGRAQGDTVDDAALAAVDALGALKTSREPASRAFLARYPRPADEIVRHHVQAAFGDTLAAAWGPVHPVDTGRAEADYLRLVRETVLPVLSGGARPRVRFVTSRGGFVVELLPDQAPLTVESFLRLTRAGFFNGQEWPRVVANFVVQGGDPRGDTSGGPGYAIRDEINRVPYLRGTLGMALSGPDTGGSQWFVTHSPQPHLDGGYTVFGRVVQGMEVVDRILQGDRIIRIEEVR